MYRWWCETGKFTTCTGIKYMQAPKYLCVKESWGLFCRPLFCVCSVPRFLWSNSNQNCCTRLEMFSNLRNLDSTFGPAFERTCSKIPAVCIAHVNKCLRFRMTSHPKKSDQIIHILIILFPLFVVREFVRLSPRFKAVDQGRRLWRKPLWDRVDPSGHSSQSNKVTGLVSWVVC